MYLFFQIKSLEVGEGLALEATLWVGEVTGGQGLRTGADLKKEIGREGEGVTEEVDRDLEREDVADHGKEDVADRGRDKLEAGVDHGADHMIGTPDVGAPKRGGGPEAETGQQTMAGHDQRVANPHLRKADRKTASIYIPTHVPTFDYDCP